MHYCIAFAFAFSLLFQLGTALPAKHSSSSKSASNSSVPSSGPCTITDISQLPSCKSGCSTITIGNLQVPAGQTLDLTKLKDGTNIVFTGTVTFGYKEWTGPLVSVSGNSIHVQGTSGSVLNGEGNRWWDGKGGNGGKVKPKFFFAHGMTNSLIQGLYIKNSPVHVFSITNADTLTITDITIDNKDGDTQGGHNTDGFGVSSSNAVTINNAKVYNQDDCLAVNSGTNIIFSNGYCSGGHGISVGSVGNKSSNVVDTVRVTGCTVVNSENGVRIKTVAGATGKVTNVSYTNIKLQNVANGITIRQDYTNAGYTGKPTNGVPITYLTIENVTGNVSKVGTYIGCAKGACSNWTWENNQLVDQYGSAAQNVCINAQCSQ